MRKIKQHTLRFLLFFYLFSSYLGATHIHHDALASHNDCKVCVVVKNLFDGDIPTLGSLPIAGETIFEQILLREKILYAKVEKGFYSQAPPLFFS